MNKSIIFLSAAVLLWAASSPIRHGDTPKDEGKVGAGEGPAWHNGELYFTGNGRIYRRDAGGTVHVFRDAPNGANGLLFDSEGRLIACETRNRRITRTERDGSI